jgi:hypothetical protein
MLSFQSGKNPKFSPDRLALGPLKRKQNQTHNEISQFYIGGIMKFESWFERKMREGGFTFYAITIASAFAVYAFLWGVFAVGYAL